jgi:hypothetical protein
MATVFKKTVTKPMPAGAELFKKERKARQTEIAADPSRKTVVEQFVRWKDGNGKSRTAKLTIGRDGSDRIVIRASTYTAKYRDGSGVVREVSTGCRDETAARRVLAELERRAELVKANVISSAEDAAAAHQDRPLAEHFADYIDHQQSKDLNKTRIKNTRSRLKRLAEECRFHRLADLSATSLERWLVARRSEGMSAGNRNEYRQELGSVDIWMV